MKKSIQKIIIAAAVLFAAGIAHNPDPCPKEDE